MRATKYPSTLQPRATVWLRALICAVFLALPAVSAWATCPSDTVYVDNSISGGACATADGTCDHPYCTIAAGLTKIAQVGGTGKVLAVKGSNTTYDEAVAIQSTHAGSSGNPFVFYARGAVTINGATTTSSWTLDTSGGDSLWKVQANAFQVIANDRRYPNCATCLNLDSLALPHNVGKCWRTGNPIYTYVNFGTGNYSSQSAYVCNKLTVKIQASHVRVDGFKIIRSTTCGIEFNPGTNPTTVSDITIQNCTVQESGEQGIDLRNASGCTLKNNSCSANSSHGIYVVGTASSCTVQDNSCFNNDDQSVDRGGSDGIRVGNGAGSSASHVIERNKVYQNEDTGIEVNGSNYNLIRYNQSWGNHDHGFDHVGATGTTHVGDLAYGNDHDGFSVESDAPGTTIRNCVMADNGRDPARKDWELEVYTNAHSNFSSDYNIIYRPTGRTGDGCTYGENADTVLVNWAGYPNLDKDRYPCERACSDSTVCFGTVKRFAITTQKDAHSKDAEPTFVNATTGNFVPQYNSATLDAADATPSDWTSTDARGFARYDFTTWPSITNTGTGSRTYDDIGPYELGPPGAPTLYVNWGDVSIYAHWTARGDEWDAGSASQWVLFLNDAPVDSGSAEAPGTFRASSITDLEHGATFYVKVRIVGQDLHRMIESNTVVGSTCTEEQCDTQGPSGGGETRAMTAELNYDLALGQPQPSPSRGTTMISWSIPRLQAGAGFDIAVFDVRGRRIATVAEGIAKPGRFTHTMSFQSGGNGAAGSGVYFLRFRIGDRRLARTLIVTR
jgi:parallel beta-helix repeat protein